MGRIMWSAFACSTYAEMGKDRGEQERLFKVGYDSGKKMLEGVINKTIPDSTLREAPIGVTMRLGGPSVDFMIGRIFESAMNDAFDEVVKEDSNGFPINDPAKWHTDDELKAAIAQNKYLHANCTIIR